MMSVYKEVVIKAYNILCGRNCDTIVQAINCGKLIEHMMMANDERKLDGWYWSGSYFEYSVNGKSSRWNKDTRIKVNTHVK